MSSYTRLRFGDVWWHVRADVASALFDSNGLRLPHWLKSGQASIVKHGPHRTVYRVQLEGRSIYIKHYRVADARALLSQWVQTSKGKREWERVNQVANSSILTTVPLALGEQRKAGFVFENYLVTEGIEEVEALDRFVETTFPTLPANRQGSMRRQLAHGLAKLVARLHDAGVLHPDLHAGNVLVRLGKSDRLELYLIDLHAAISTGRASWRRSRENLLAFGLYFWIMADDWDHLRFLRSYLDARRHLGLNWKDEAARLHGDLRNRARWHWHRLDKRCITNNRRFFYRDIGTSHGFAVTGLTPDKFLALLRDPDAPLKSNQARVLKDSPSSEVVQLPMTLGDATIPVIYKRFNCPKRFDCVRSTLYRSPALRAWHAGHALLIRNIPTPRPLLIIERTRWGLVHESYLVTEAVPDSTSLRDYLNQVAAILAAPARRSRVRRLAEQIGTLVRQMHERNMSHRDMKAANFLVTPADPSAESPQVSLIDLAAVQNWRTLPTIRRYQNLARILASLQSYAAIGRTDLLRVLRAYLPDGLRHRTEWKAIAKSLLARINEKIAQNIERNRSLT